METGHKKIIKRQLISFEIMKYSLKWSHYSLSTHFEWEKLSFDDFLVTTWEQEVESQRKNKPQIPPLILIENSTFFKAILDESYASKMARQCQSLSISSLYLICYP